MTQFNYTGASLTVTSSTNEEQTWELVADEFYGQLTGDPTMSHIYHANNDFNVVVTIKIELWIGKPPCRFGDLLTEDMARVMSATDHYIYSGYLLADEDWCALCDDQRHITVRVAVPLGDIHVIVADSDEQLADELGAVANSTRDITLPCPACRVPEYLLAKGDHLREVDS